MKILVLNGPNLNLLGSREPHLYGSTTLDDIVLETTAELSTVNVDLIWKQSNSELELISWIQAARLDKTDAIVINPAGLSHTSVALRDALMSFNGKKVEVHLSNTYKREQFRTVKLTSAACDGVVEGFGKRVYAIALLNIISGED